MESLPAEIIGQIASNLYATEVFALASTSHYIRSCCWDAWTFSCILEKTQHEWQYQTLNLNDIKRRSSKDVTLLLNYGASGSGSRTWLDATRIFVPSILVERYGLDADLMAKYAMADFKALQLCERLDEQARVWNSQSDLLYLEERAFEALYYIPQLIILKHPCLHAPSLVYLFWHFCTLLDTQGDGDDAETDLSIESSFALSAVLASQDMPYVRPSGRYRSQSPTFEERLSRQLKRISSHFKLVNDRMRADHALMLVGVVSCLLRTAFRSYKVRRMIGSAYYSFLLPFVVEMPFEENRSWRTVPIPFDALDAHASERSWSGWISACAQSMIDSITDSEWVGIGCEVISASNHRGASHQFDAPMTGIHFTTVKERTPGKTILEAPGADSVSRAQIDNLIRACMTDEILNQYGSFTLGGYATDEGHIKLVKWYRNGAGIGYEWTARMTPFGIIGVWRLQDMTSQQQQRQNPVLGTVWLWKKEWTFKDGIARS